MGSKQSKDESEMIVNLINATRERDFETFDQCVDMTLKKELRIQFKDQECSIFHALLLNSLAFDYDEKMLTKFCGSFKKLIRKHSINKQKSSAFKYLCVYNEKVYKGLYNNFFIWRGTSDEIYCFNPENVTHKTITGYTNDSYYTIDSSRGIFDTINDASDIVDIDIDPFILLQRLRLILPNNKKFVSNVMCKILFGDENVNVNSV